MSLNCHLIPFVPAEACPHRWKFVTGRLCEVRRCVPHGSLPPCGGGNAVTLLCLASRIRVLVRRCVHTVARKPGPSPWAEFSALVSAFAEMNGVCFNRGANLDSSRSGNRRQWLHLQPRAHARH